MGGDPVDGSIALAGRGGVAAGILLGIWLGLV